MKDDRIAKHEVVHSVVAVRFRYELRQSVDLDEVNVSDEIGAAGVWLPDTGDFRRLCSRGHFHRWARNSGDEPIPAWQISGGLGETRPFPNFGLSAASDPIAAVHRTIAERRDQTLSSRR